MPKPVHPNQLLLFAQITAIGTGEWRITAQRPTELISVQQAAQLLGVSIWSVYRTVREHPDKLHSFRPRAGRIKLYRDSVETFRVACEDPEFWRSKPPFSTPVAAKP